MKTISDRKFLVAMGMEFKLERIRQNLTQRQLAEKCKLHQITISVIEKGSQASRVHILKRVADGLGKPLSNFV